MKNLLNLLLLFISFSGFTQTTTEYFADRYLSKETSEKKANFLLIKTINPDGSTTRKVIKVSDQTILSLENFNGQEPVGKWVVYQNKKIMELDYDFPLVYAEKSWCNANDSTFIPSPETGPSNPLKDFDSIGYIAPVAIVGIKDITRQMVYPDQAIDEGLMGEVHIGFRISASAEVTDLYVVKGAHPLLDKEALRCFRMLKFKSPAMVNGIPKAVCLKQKFTFKME